ncbi:MULTISPECIES: hypothetical protein [Photorhabdus]|uniref:Uncharacterized protein n=2 Tax=Photorhabdus TaxID=29487 RepID=A0AAW6BQQ4_9GAMM|nr:MULTISPECIES: hypothetical protein [Photorhabdus]EYU15103.1 hypothetical protein BA1DRAFT_02373 [Photorhabdus aegyptia]MDB6373947.1 hypothetical protein [Photorhabdus bodei]
MAKKTLFTLSAVFSLTATATLISVFLLFDKSTQINAMQKKTSGNSYLSSRDVMDKEMAEVLLPYLQKQKAKEKLRGTVKKPDTVYVPEQLQQSRGY